MTVKVILHKMKYLRIHNVSIHIDFYQNQFINECFRKTDGKTERRKDVKTEFFVRCRRIYVLNSSNTKRVKF